MEKAKRKQLLDDYKHTHRPMGIYQIRNLKNGKRFIDSSMYLDTVFNKQRFVLDLGSHMNKELQQEWRTDGAGQFVFEVVDELIPDKEEALIGQEFTDKYKPELDALRELWMEKLQPYGEMGYHKKRRARQ